MMLDWHVLVEIGLGRTIVVSGESYEDVCKAAAAVRNLVKTVEGFEAERKQWGETVDDFARIGGCLAEERDRLKTENERLRADRQHFYDLAMKSGSELTEAGERHENLAVCYRQALREKLEAESKVVGCRATMDKYDELSRRLMAERNDAQAELKEASAQLGDSQLDRIKLNKENRELKAEAERQAILAKNSLSSMEFDRDKWIKITEEHRSTINALKAELEQLRAVPLVEITGVDARAICCDTVTGPMTMVMNNAPACIKITGHARFHVTKSEPTGYF